MNGVVREWLDKAKGDYETAKREAAVTERPNYDAVCFHAQQCVEKMMKAVLIASAADAPKIHDLVGLSHRVAEQHPSWSWPAAELKSLSRAAVGFRYPDFGATREEVPKRSISASASARG